MNNEWIELGRVAFNAYAKAKGNKTYDGKPIHAWDELPNIDSFAQEGWRAAAIAVMQAVRAEDEGQAAAQLIALRGQVDEVLKIYNGHAKPCETVSDGIVKLAELIRRYDEVS